ncbi:hypothetical protein DVH24_004959 [Malus domestica]|uniref:Uncharacterized protein n=1 Tax=Malus domestica TaxID=3750 RepID=A0A498IFZ7_MALDO|nr:hypothetical protein DVH24_004959 [Malus domestica]
MIKKDEDNTAFLDGLTEKKIDVFADWEKNFEAYPVIEVFHWWLQPHRHARFYGLHLSSARIAVVGNVGLREMLEDNVSGSIREEDNVSGSQRDSDLFYFFMNSKLYLKILYRRCLMEVAGISRVVNVRVRIFPSKRVTNKF